jgi:hypothetical protein
MGRIVIVAGMVGGRPAGLIATLCAAVPGIIPLVGHLRNAMSPVGIAEWVMGKTPEPSDVVG